MEIALERIVGRKVYTKNGRAIGRLEEIHAENIDGDLQIVEFMIGPLALLERLATAVRLQSLLRWFGRRSKSYCLPWFAVDLTNPEHPLVRGTMQELATYERPAM